MSLMITSQPVSRCIVDISDKELNVAFVVNHLQNMTNTLIFPQLPTLWSRRPEVNLPESSAADDTSYVIVSSPSATLCLPYE